MRLIHYGLVFARRRHRSPCGAPRSPVSATRSTFRIKLLSRLWAADGTEPTDREPPLASSSWVGPRRRREAGTPKSFRPARWWNRTPRRLGARPHETLWICLGHAVHPSSDNPRRRRSDITIRAAASRSVDEWQGMAAAHAVRLLGQRSPMPEVSTPATTTLSLKSSMNCHRFAEG